MVRADPAQLEVGEGQIETLRILLVDAQNVYGIDLQAAYNPAVVEVVDADGDQDGIQMTPGTFLQPDFVVRNTADNRQGSLHYVVTQLNPTPPATGEGVILVVQFRGKVVGGQSKLTFDSVQIADRRGVKLPVVAQDADLLIVPPKQATPTPIPNPSAANPLPTGPTLMAATPSLFIPTSTRLGAQPTKMSTRVATLGKPAAESKMEVTSADQMLTYVAVGGFSVSLLLFGLSFWLLFRKRRARKRRE